MKNRWTPAMLLLLCLLLVQGLGGLGGGILMVLRPDGSWIQMPLEWLDHSPFDNFLVPGLILSLVLGLFPLFVLAALLIRPEVPVLQCLNVYPNRHWSLTFALYTGIMLVCWIQIQLLMVQRYFWLQPVMALIGVGIIIFSVVPGTIRLFESPRAPGSFE